MARSRKTPRRPGLDDKRYWANRDHLKRTGNHICHWCRRAIDMQLKWPHPLSWTCDHIIPRSTLTHDDPRHWALSNMTEAHKRCNESRGAKPIVRPTGLNTSRAW